MKKIFYFLACVLELGLFGAAYAFQYYAARRLGLIRWINYHEAKLMARLPVETLKYISVAVALLFAALTVSFYLNARRRKRLPVITLPMTILTSALALSYLWFVLLKSTASIRAYYFMLPLWCSASLVQSLKTFLTIFFVLGLKSKCNTWK